MSAVLTACEPSARYLVQQPLVQHFELMATAPGGVARLRKLILTLAVQGKLVPQDPKDEPASELLKKIRAEKDRLLTVGKIKRDKPLAEITEEEKPFELPRGWEWVRLGEVTEVLDSLRKPVTKVDRQPGPYPYYGASGIVDYVSTYIFDEPLVLVGEDGAKWDAGEKTAFTISGRTWVNNHAHVLRPRRAAIEDMYLVNVLTALDLSEFITGMTVPKLNQARLVSIPFALPPIDEQSRIVKRVELMRLCDALEAKGQLEATQHTQLVSTLLATLTDSETPAQLADNWHRIATHFDLLLDRPEAVDALEQTILQLAVRGLLVPQDPKDEPAGELLKKIRAEKDKLIAEGKIRRDKSLPPIAEDEQPFALPKGWIWIRFDELTHPLKPIAYGVLVPGPDVETGVPFVRIADLSLTDPPEKPEKSIAPEVDAQFQRTRLEGGEILMGVVGSIGKLGVAPRTWAGANVARAICRIVPADSGLNEFVLLLLQTQFMQESFAGDTRTLAQPTLNVGLIRAALTPLPPPSEQTRIVARVAQLRSLCADLRQRLATSQATQAQLAAALVAAQAPLDGIMLMPPDGE